MAYHSIELRNKSFQLIQVLNKNVKNLSWNFDRIGGCGDCTLDLAVSSLADIGADYDIQIKLDGTLIYRGYVESYKPVVGNPDTVQLKISGYCNQLGRIRVNQTYTNQEVSVIIKAILDTYILPNTQITYSSSDIEATEFSVDSIEFDTMAEDAIKTLAELAGYTEWGVDKNKNFYFKKQNENVTKHVKLGKEIERFDEIDDYAGIVNRIYIKGGKVEDEVFTLPVNNTESQAAYGLREDVVSNSSIVSNVVAQRYGTMTLADKAKIQRKITLKISKCTQIFEDAIPLGRIDIQSVTAAAAKKYNDADAIYGRFLYGGFVSFQLYRIKYTLKDEALEVDINAGYARPDIADQIQKLSNEIEQVRNTT